LCAIDASLADIFYGEFAVKFIHKYFGNQSTIFDKNLDINQRKHAEYESGTIINITGLYIEISGFESLKKMYSNYDVTTFNDF